MENPVALGSRFNPHPGDSPSGNDLSVIHNPFSDPHDLVSTSPCLWGFLSFSLDLFPVGNLHSVLLGSFETYHFVFCSHLTWSPQSTERKGQQQGEQQRGVSSAFLPLFGRKSTELPILLSIPNQWSFQPTSFSNVHQLPRTRATSAPRRVHNPRGTTRKKKKVVLNCITTFRSSGLPLKRWCPDFTHTSSFTLFLNRTLYGTLSILLDNSFPCSDCLHPCPSYTTTNMTPWLSFPAVHYTLMFSFRQSLCKCASLSDKTLTAHNGPKSFLRTVTWFSEIRRGKESLGLIVSFLNLKQP